MPYNDGIVLSSTVAFDYDKDRDGPRQWIECDLPDNPGIEEYCATLPPEEAERWGKL
jgi:hypothetical protein